MPIYEYRCEKCGTRHEVMQKFSDPPLTSCPACGGELHKLISNTSFVLKGSGWYVTDYASGDRKKAMESEKPAEGTATPPQTNGAPSKGDPAEKKETAAGTPSTT